MNHSRKPQSMDRGRGPGTRRAAIYRGADAWWIDSCDADEYREGLTWHLKALLADSARHTSRPTHREALAYALAETGLLSDGDPHTDCGRGPCALGHGHHGACRC